MNAEISDNEAMYRSNVRGYLQIGKSALDCILEALICARKFSVCKILDFACGHGRVLRFLRKPFLEERCKLEEPEHTIGQCCASSSKAIDLVLKNTSLELINSVERGWAGRQDVYSFKKTEDLM